jgi:hypothetical protein
MSGKPSLSSPTRDAIVQEYKAGTDIEVVCKKYGVGRGVIERILIVGDVPIRKAPGGYPQTASDVEAEVVKLYRDDLIGSTTIAKKFGVCKKTVFNILQRHGVGRRPKGAGRVRTKKKFSKTPRISDRDIKISTMYAEGVDVKDIAKEVGLNLQTVYHSLQKRGLFVGEGSDWQGETNPIKPNYFRTGYQRRSALREDAFDELDPEALYWAGFIMADGNIHKDITRPSYRLTIRLALHDMVALIRFKEWIGAGVKIVTGEAPDDRRFKDRKFCVIMITSNAICHNLMALGITPQKSGAGNQATASEECAHDRNFWRGMIDGDGCVYEAGSGTFYLSGSKVVTQQFMGYCRELVPSCEFRHDFHLSWCGKEGCWVAAVSHRADAEILLKHLYQGAVWALPRKILLANTHFH